MRSTCDVDFSEQARDVPLPLLRMIDLARALARDPALLLLDEITAALPSDLAERVFAVMRSCRERGRSVLFITHRLKEVIASCDRATILRDGTAVATIVPREGGEESIVEHMLGAEAAQASAMAVERDAGAVHPQVAAGATPALEVTGLAAGQVSGLSFALQPGEVLGIAALEGQGQNELFAVLSGQASPAAGEIRAGGRVLKSAPSVRLDSSRCRARPRRPPTGAASAAFGAREHRRPSLQLGQALGAHQHA